MDKKSKWGFSTKSIHVGNEADEALGSVSPPIHLSSTFKQDGVGNNRGHDYSRVSNPTRDRLEENLVVLDGAKYAICYSTGMAATTALFQLFDAGDHIIISRNTYGGTYRMAMNVLKRQGIEFDWIDTREPENIKKYLKPNTKLVHVETPTNPLLKVTDLHAINKIAKENQLYFCVDSTFSTPVFLRPLEFGADMVIHSTTKYISGHNQVIGGAVITDKIDLFDEMKFVQKTIGAVPSPFDCWLTLLGSKTLHLRMQKHAENAQIIAEFLKSHSKVLDITFPGLTSHPQHETAKDQMDGFSGMICFELKGGIEAGRKLMNNVRLCALAESLGAVETMITHPATMTHVDVPVEERNARGLTDGLVRLSIGIEDPIDILNDLELALDKV